MWSSSCRIVIRRSSAAPGRYAERGCVEIDPAVAGEAENERRGVRLADARRGRTPCRARRRSLPATSARPLVPVHDVPSRKMIVTDTPGIPSRARTSSSSTWRLDADGAIAPGSRPGCGPAVRPVGVGTGVGIAVGRRSAGGARSGGRAAADGVAELPPNPVRSLGWPRPERATVERPIPTARKPIATMTAARTRRTERRRGRGSSRRAIMGDDTAGAAPAGRERIGGLDGPVARVPRRPDGGVRRNGRPLSRRPPDDADPLGARRGLVPSSRRGARSTSTARRTTITTSSDPGRSWGSSSTTSRRPAGR